MPNNPYKMIGMSWYDSSQSDAEEKITQAIEYFKNKYGYVPEHIGVCPEQYSIFAEDVRVFPARVQKNTLWLIFNYDYEGEV